MTPTPTTDSAVSPVRELSRPIEQALDALTNLARDLRAELEKPGMTIRNVAAFTGVDKSTVLRAKQQKPISADAYIALSLWLNLSRRSLDTADGVEPIVWRWQTSYTGDRWHYAEEVSFAARDIELGIVKNVTPLFASRTPNTEVAGHWSDDKTYEEAPGERGEAEPDFYAVHSSTGAHIGLWSVKEYAYRNAEDYEDCTITPLYASPPSPAQTVTDAIEALKPLAAIADDYADAEDDDFQVWKDFDVLGATLPLKHFRKARSALTALTAALAQPSKEG